MFNKKGGVDLGEIIGLLVFMFGAFMIMFIFYGCSQYNDAIEYKEIEFSKEEIEAHKTLNFFLEMPVDDERKISDLIIESNLNEDYGELHDMVKNYFLQKPYEYWVLRLYKDSLVYDSILYESINYNYLDSIHYCTSGGNSEAYIISMDQSLELEVTLFITNRCY